MNNAILAFDRQSVRSVDADGIMHISKTPISKANVCWYGGDEIPGAEELGLDLNKKYRVYRHPDELAKGAATFNNKPVLNTHKRFTIANPPKELIVGMTGDDAVFEEPYLYNSMSVYDAKQQAGIESNQHREISSSYYWTPDLTPGISPDGEPYDIIMRDIIGNHVAIVPDGRAGSDVLVYDSQPLGQKIMSKFEKLWAMVKPKLAADADPEALKKELEAVDDEEQTEADRDDESEAERLKRREKREDKDRERDRERERDRKRADDAEEDDDKKDKKDKKSADDEEDDKKSVSAEDAEEMAKTACDALRAEFKQLREAERICAPHVGRLACDSAEELYRATLKHAGVEGYASLPVAALKPMVGMLGKKMANDSAQSVSVDKVQAVRDFFGSK